jgi:molybdopterin converting factor small subunit
MAIHVTISKYLRHYTGGQAIAEVSGRTVKAALEDLFSHFPDMRRCMFQGDDETQIRRFMHVYRNGQEVCAADLAKGVDDGDELILIPEVA